MQISDGVYIDWFSNRNAQPQTSSNAQRRLNKNARQRTSKSARRLTSVSARPCTTPGDDDGGDNVDEIGYDSDEEKPQNRQGPIHLSFHLGTSSSVALGRNRSVAVFHSSNARRWTSSLSFSSWHQSFSSSKHPSWPQIILILKPSILTT